MINDLGGIAFYAFGIAIYLLIVVAAVYLLYTVIRLAVRKGMRQHQEWLDGRADDASTTGSSVS